MSVATLIPPRTVTDLDRYYFDLNGFVVIPDVLDRETVARLNEVVERHLAVLERPHPEKRLGGFGSMLPVAAEFRALIDHEPLIPYLTEWLGPNYRLDHDYAMVIRPGSSEKGATHIHGGHTPYNASRIYSCINGAIHSTETAVSYALTDVRPGDGGMGVIPGSHKANFPLPWAADPGPYSDTNLRQVPIRAGSAVIFTESLTHCSLPWRSDQVRRTLFYKYTPRHITVSKAVYQRPSLPGLTDRQRALLDPAHS